MANQINRIGANLLSQFTGGAQNQRAWRGCFEITQVGRVFTLWLFEWRFAASDRLRT